MESGFEERLRQVHLAAEDRELAEATAVARAREFVPELEKAVDHLRRLSETDPERARRTLPWHEIAATGYAEGLLPRVYFAAASGTWTGRIEVTMPTRPYPGKFVAVLTSGTVALELTIPEDRHGPLPRLRANNRKPMTFEKAAALGILRVKASDDESSPTLELPMPAVFSMILDLIVEYCTA